MKKIFTTLTVFAALTLSAQNLLTNHSFESDFEGWASGPNSAYTAPEIVTGGAQDGDKSVAYNAVSATTGFYQTVPVTEGEVYEINFWYKSSGDETDSRLWSIFRDASGAAVYTTADATEDEFRTNNGYLPTAGEWTFHSAQMPAGPGAVSLEVAVRAYTGGNASFDNFAAGIEGTLMSVSDVNEFSNLVKMNTVVTDKLTLQLPERATVNIYTMEGKLISSNRVDNGGSVATSSLAKGVYVVTVSNGYTTTTQKIVKK
ncbi:MAG: T9SS type A sorting domain-containing protein [Moheibacter sp.]